VQDAPSGKLLDRSQEAEASRDFRRESSGGIKEKGVRIQESEAGSLLPSLFELWRIEERNSVKRMPIRKHCLFGFYSVQIVHSVHSILEVR